jgi:hypothetical protein
MTDGRPWPGRDLLADLDAGVLDDDRAAQVRAAAAEDARATAVLAAFAATRADLAALPEPDVPAGVAARWDAALAAEAGRREAEGPEGPVAATETGTALGRLVRYRPALAAAAVLAVALVAGLLLLRPGVPGPDRLPLERVDLVAAGRAALGATDAGELADPARRAACLAVVAPPGVWADAPFLGGRRVDLDGRQGVLLALGSGELGRFHVVVVDPGCGPAGGQLLGWEVIGR